MTKPVGNNQKFKYFHLFKVRLQILCLCNDFIFDKLFNKTNQTIKRLNKITSSVLNYLNWFRKKDNN